MPIVLTLQEATAITNTLSTTRMATYQAAITQAANGFSASATEFDIYVWNALISGAFFSTLHICEIAIRNGIADALKQKYGASWPWDIGFERTLAHDEKQQLIRERNRFPVGATGKVIAELKFAFWGAMFTSRHDLHLWNDHLFTSFPFLPSPLTVVGRRIFLHAEINKIRKFRNRIAHHEPIFTYRLGDHHKRINDILNARCGDTSRWVRQWETVTATLAAKP